MIVVKITLDNGKVFILESLINLEAIKPDNAPDAGYIIRGIDNQGNTHQEYYNNTPEAIRTIEFLP